MIRKYNHTKLLLNLAIFPNNEVCGEFDGAGAGAGARLESLLARRLGGRSET